MPHFLTEIVGAFRIAFQPIASLQLFTECLMAEDSWLTWPETVRVSQYSQSLAIHVQLRRRLPIAETPPTMTLKFYRLEK